MHADFKTLLIPVESQVRELDGKILLACTAAEKGYRAIIGSRAYIHYYSSRTRNAIYIAKSMRRFSDRMFGILHDLGHRIVAWDEEALVRLPDNEYYLHRLSPNNFKHIDHLFAWGESNATVLKQYPGYQGQPIHLFGNPRVDIIRPELREYFRPEVDKITQQYGDFLLINTNFGQVNHFINTQGKKEASRDKNFDAKFRNNYMSNRFSHKQKLFDYFKELIPSLSKQFPNINFIVRPHPSENLGSWRDLLSENNNVHVVNNGNVIPWIIASSGLISNGCTTSIEASILEKPTLGYYPISNLETDDALPKALCDVCTTDQQLYSLIDSIVSGTYKTSIKKDVILSQHISNISGSFSTDQIIDTLHYSYASNIFKEISLVSRVKGILHNEARTFVKHLNSTRKSHRNSNEYHKHRFPGIDKNYLLNRVKRLNRLTNRFNNINIEALSNNVYAITT